MTITCPHCGFSKEIDPQRLPAGAARVTCPQCQEKFSLTPAEPAPEPVFPVEAPMTPPAASPKAPPIAPVVTEKPVLAADLPKAGFWIRVVASLVDSILVSIVQFALGFALGLLITMIAPNLNQNGQAMLSIITALSGMVIGVFYYVFFTGYCGQTPGKMAVRIKVIVTDGSDIGYGKAFFREVIGKFVSTLLLCIGYLMVAFDAQKQGLHDKMSDTYVIKL